MSAHEAFPVSAAHNLIRIAYASRATRPIDTAHLADTSARSNRRRAVSGVILQGNGLYLQWIEGPDADVCALMARIAGDPRHGDMTVLGAGRISERRFGAWPMRLGARRLDPAVCADVSTDGSPCHAHLAEQAFDDLALQHRRQVCPSETGTLCDPRFIASLVAPDIRAQLPDAALASLRARAALVDETCDRFGYGWHEDRWSTFDVSVGLAALYRLWCACGRVADPVCATRAVTIVVPPGSSEVIGAIVKTDLFRDAGVSVRLVLERTEAAMLAAIDAEATTPILVVGPRVGLTGDADRADALAERLQRRFPRRAVHLGGRASGALAEWPERLALRAHDAAAFNATLVSWLARAAITSVARPHAVH
jgi:hypothetical protein